MTDKNLHPLEAASRVGAIDEKSGSLVGEGDITRSTVGEPSTARRGTTPHGEGESYREDGVVPGRVSKITPEVNAAIQAGEMELPDNDFLGAREASKLRKFEKPEHRLCIMLKAQGRSNRDIAEELGKSTQWVADVVKQPWARTRLAQMITQAGKDELKELISSAAIDSVYTLIEVRDDPKAKPSERVIAADKLLDRFLGKPTQKVEQTVQTNVPDNVEDLDRRLEELRRAEGMQGTSSRN